MIDGLPPTGSRAGKPDRTQHDSAGGRRKPLALRRSYNTGSPAGSLAVPPRHQGMHSPLASGTPFPGPGFQAAVSSPPRFGRQPPVGASIPSKPRSSTTCTTRPRQSTCGRCGSPSERPGRPTARTRRACARLPVRGLFADHRRCGKLAADFGKPGARCASAQAPRRPLPPLLQRKARGGPPGTTERCREHRAEPAGTTAERPAPSTWKGRSRSSPSAPARTTRA